MHLNVYSISIRVRPVINKLFFFWSDSNKQDLFYFFALVINKLKLKSQWGQCNGFEPTKMQLLSTLNEHSSTTKKQQVYMKIPLQFFYPKRARRYHKTINTWCILGEKLSCFHSSNIQKQKMDDEFGVVHCYVNYYKPHSTAL